VREVQDPEGRRCGTMDFFLRHKLMQQSQPIVDEHKHGHDINIKSVRLKEFSGMCGLVDLRSGGYIEEL
jgi:hypothetical protein